LAENHIIDAFTIAIDKLKAQEKLLEEQLAYYDHNFSGLKDIGLIFELIITKLDLALIILDQQRSFKIDRQDMAYQAAQEKAAEGINLFESLTKENISLDQQELIKEAPEIAAIKEKINQLIAQGGGVFFEKQIAGDKKRKKIARVINTAILKFVSADDRYEPLFKTERLPGFLKKLVHQFLPVFGKEYQKDPPYGIEEGEEEEVCFADKIKMPISQAVYYLENELIPGLEEKLAQNPGDKGLQQKIRLNREKLAEYKSIHITPRVRPLVVERGFFTDTYTGYTLEGEPLVSMPVSVKFRSGTNLDRIQYYVKSEIVRQLAGQGIVEELDREYKRLKKLESGTQGNSRTPGFKIDTEKWFAPLKQQIPILNLIENKKDFLMIINTVTSSGKQQALRYIEDLLNLETNTLKTLPWQEE